MSPFLSLIPEEGHLFRRGEDGPGLLGSGPAESNRRMESVQNHVTEYRMTHLVSFLVKKKIADRHIEVSGKSYLYLITRHTTASFIHCER